VVGLGNPLVGDDGVGVVVLETLRRRWGDTPGLLLATLEGDIYAVADLLGQAERFLFVDAVAGETPGELSIAQPGAGRALAPSLHQADVGTVMRGLAELGLVEPFPPWEVWGVTVLPPTELRIGLSPAVEAGVEALLERIDAFIATVVGRLAEPGAGGEERTLSVGGRS
jgi:hydrogenase maturation protease